MLNNRYFPKSVIRGSCKTPSPPFPRRRESSLFNHIWIPAPAFAGGRLFAGTTGSCHFCKRFIRSAILFLLLAGFSIACGTKDSGKPNVFLVTLDTVRADHLSCYGYDRETTPFLDQLAGQGILYTNAYSASSWTLPSHASMFTGLFPRSHGAVFTASGEINIYDAPCRPLRNDVDTLAEILKGAGYRTAGFVGGPYCASSFGLSQGFDHYDDRWEGPKRDGSELTDKCLQWLKGNLNSESPVFVFINYFDAHATYNPPKEFQQFVPKEPAVYAFDKLRDKVMGDLKDLTQQQIETLIGRYDGEIRYLDTCIKRLYEWTFATSTRRNTIWIFVGDHGESFGDHRLMEHHSLYEDVIHVPMIILPPSRSNVPPRRVDASVSQIDILPTLLKYLGIEPTGGLPGIDILAPDLPLDRLIVAETTRCGFLVRKYGKRFDRDNVAILKHPYKLILDSLGEQDEMYDLANDRGEQLNKIAEKPDLVKGLRDQAVLWEKSTLVNQAAPSSRRIDAETLNSLKTLGYTD